MASNSSNAPHDEDNTGETEKYLDRLREDRISRGLVESASVYVEVRSEESQFVEDPDIGRRVLEMTGYDGADNGERLGRLDVEENANSESPDVISAIRMTWYDRTVDGIQEHTAALIPVINNGGELVALGQDDKSVGSGRVATSWKITGVASINHIDRIAKTTSRSGLNLDRPPADPDRKQRSQHGTAKIPAGYANVEVTGPFLRRAEIHRKTKDGFTGDIGHSFQVISAQQQTTTAGLESMDFYLGSRDLIFLDPQELVNYERLLWDMKTPLNHFAGVDVDGVFRLNQPLSASVWNCKAQTLFVTMTCTNK